MMNRLRKIIYVIHQELYGLHIRLIIARIILAFLPTNAAGRLRARILGLAGFEVGQGVIFLGVPKIVGGGNIYKHLKIGKSVFFNAGCFLDLAGEIHIGDWAAIGPEAMLITGAHAIGSPYRRAGDLSPKPVCIGNGAWLGARCIVLPGISIGEGAIVAAGAVVTKNVPSNTLVAGIPAAYVRDL
jgi:maltose O-acetyltransferase